MSWRQITDNSTGCSKVCYANNKWKRFHVIPTDIIVLSVVGPPVARLRILTCFAYLPMLPWIFPGTPLKINGAPGNNQGNFTALLLRHRISWCQLGRHWWHWKLSKREWLWLFFPFLDQPTFFQNGRRNLARVLGISRVYCKLTVVGILADEALAQSIRDLTLPHPVRVAGDLQLTGVLERAVVAPEGWNKRSGGVSKTLISS